jgi:hypothetical protein
MSHTMNIVTELKDYDAIAIACSRLGFKLLGVGKHHLYGSEESGLAVQIPGWNYPVVIHADGTVAYDTYNGQWGNEKQLTQLIDVYGLEKARMEAQKLGYTCFESVNENNELELEVVIEN